MDPYVFSRNDGYDSDSDSSQPPPEYPGEDSNDPPQNPESFYDYLTNRQSKDLALHNILKSILDNTHQKNQLIDLIEQAQKKISEDQDIISKIEKTTTNVQEIFCALFMDYVASVAGSDPGCYMLRYDRARKNQSLENFNMIFNDFFKKYWNIRTTQVNELFSGFDADMLSFKEANARKRSELFKCWVFYGVATGFIFLTLFIAVTTSTSIIPIIIVDSAIIVTSWVHAYFQTNIPPLITQSRFKAVENTCLSIIKALSSPNNQSQNDSQKNTTTQLGSHNKVDNSIHNTINLGIGDTHSKKKTDDNPKKKKNNENNHFKEIALLALGTLSGPLLFSVKAYKEEKRAKIFEETISIRNRNRY